MPGSDATFARVGFRYKPPAAPSRNDAPDPVRITLSDGYGIEISRDDGQARDRRPLYAPACRAPARQRESGRAKAART